LYRPSSHCGCSWKYCAPSVDNTILEVLCVVRDQHKRPSMTPP
jgi:hypothetical protein